MRLRETLSPRRALLAAVTALALTGCSGPADCAPCPSDLVLDPQGLVPAGRTAASYRVCLDDACQDLPPLAPYEQTTQSYRPTIPLRGNLPPGPFKRVTATAFAGSEILGEASGTNLAQPPGADGGACDCNTGSIQLDQSSGQLVIV